MSYDEAAFLRQAHPIFKMRLVAILAELRALGWQPRIWHVTRTETEQAEKVKKGYSKTMKSWHVESTEGHLPAGPGRADIVHGSAADIVDRRYAWEGKAANLKFQFWMDLGAAAKKQGCEWGGDWKTFPDVAHVQMLYVEMPAQSTTTQMA